MRADKILVIDNLIAAAREAMRVAGEAGFGQ
jgi:hypothetical protein